MRERDPPRVQERPRQAAFGERSDERVNSRNGYRQRRWDTRVGTIDLNVPKLREGSYFPQWLLVHRRRAEQALASVVAQAYVEGVSTRRVDDLGGGDGDRRHLPLRGVASGRRAG